MENSISLGNVIVMGLGIAISPIPIIVVLLLLFTANAKRSGIAFLLGWLTGLVIVGGLVLFLANTGREMAGGNFSFSAYGLKLLVGLFFLIMAVNSWRTRPRRGEEPTMPRWMSRIDRIGSGESYGLGVMNTGLNPKNLALTLAAALSIVQAGFNSIVSWVAPVLFVLIASISVAVPVLYYLAAGERAEKTLNGWKAWLIANNNVIMTLLFLVLGTNLVIEAAVGILA